MKCVIINETSELREKKVLINALISTETSKTVNNTTKQSILLFALHITEKGLGWSQQKRPHAPPDIANYLMLSVVYRYCHKR